MEIVNGFVCLNCADVAQAKRHIDPSGKVPHAAAVSSHENNQTQVNSVDEAAGVNSPLATGPRGTQINLLI